MAGLCCLSQSYGSLPQPGLCCKPTEARRLQPFIFRNKSQVLIAGMRKNFFVVVDTLLYNYCRFQLVSPDSHSRYQGWVDAAAPPVTSSCSRFTFWQLALQNARDACLHRRKKKTFPLIGDRELTTADTLTTDKPTAREEFRAK